jgi:hypothetical protein
MAEQAGTLFVKLELDDTGFVKGLDQAQSTAEKGGGFLSKAFEFATGNLIAGGLTTLAGKIVDVGKSMISGNAEFERYETQFGVLLGSTDKAKDRLAELAKFGASTPFELPELVKADKILTSFGLHSEDMLTIVGDVAAGTGASFEDMSLLMGKFSAGSTGEVISRFAEMGIATKTELQKMGIEFDKAGSMTTPVATAMPILEQLMKDKFGGMMAAQSQTFEGMTSNLQDWVGSTIRTLGVPIFEVVKDKLGVLLTFLSDPATMAALNSFAETLANGIGVAMDFLANTVIPAMIQGWTDLQPVLAVLVNLVSDLAIVWSNTLQPALMQIVAFIASNIQPILAGLAAVLVTVVVPAFVAWAAGAVAAATATIIALAPVLIPLAAIGLAVAALKAAWDNNFFGIRDTLTAFWTNTGQPIFDQLQAWLATNLPIAIQALTDFWNNTLLPALTAVWSFISTYVIPIIVEIIQVHFAALKIMLQSVADFWNTILLPAITAVWSFLKNSIIPLITALIDVHFALFQLAMAKVTELWELMKGAFEATWGFIQGYLMPVLKLLTNAALGPLSDMAKTVGGAFNNTVKPAFTALSDAVTGVVNPALDAMSGIIGSVKSAIGGIGSVISGAISWLHKLADAIRSIPSMPSGAGVPGFASGTNFAPGGFALVGERGPELVNLPRGSQVIPANQTAAMMKGGPTNNYYITANYKNNQSESSLMNDVRTLQMLSSAA